MKQSPEQWPEAFQRLQHAGDPQFPEVFLRQLNEIALDRWPVRRRTAWFAAAALVPVALSIAAWFFWIRNPTVLHPDVVPPGATVVSEQGETILSKGQPVREGDVILLSRSGLIYFREGFTLRGPAALEIRSREEWRLRFGELQVQTPQRAAIGSTGSIWTTEHHRYVRTGTTARLIVTPTRETMLVWKGSFRVEVPGGASKSLLAGEKLVLPMQATIPPPVPLSRAELTEGDQLAKDGLMPRVTEPVAALPGTEEERVRLFGPRQEIRLKDGRVFRGYVRMEDQRVEVRTPNERLQFDKDAIESVKKISAEKRRRP